MGRIYRIGCAVCLLAVMFVLRAHAADDVELAIQGPATLREAAIVRLRDAGPAGLEQLLARLQELEQSQATNQGDQGSSDELHALNQALDQVGGAKYCRQSRLYWYTDLAQAKAAALAACKPILALRMMGNLTDEFSCANGRFFRTTLYANAEISQFLRENFILHWQSVRPVPKVTIDFGDGRKLERTLTGNSIHYVLTPNGEVVHALPGLYGPGKFLAQVKQAAQLVSQLSALPEAARPAALEVWRRSALSNIASQWQADLVAVTATSQQAPVSPQLAAPPARAAALVASTKGDAELPLLAALQTQFAGLEQQTSDDLWEQIALRHREEARLDAASRQLVAAHAPPAARAARLAITKSFVESPLVRVVRNLDRSIALDTVKNEYLLHRQLLVWLIEKPELARDVNALNERVYAELFLTPSSDPWLGLSPPDVYTALPNNGVVAVPQQATN